jgi:molecular chaperone GrpE
MSKAKSETAESEQTPDPGVAEPKRAPGKAAEQAVGAEAQVEAAEAKESPEERTARLEAEVAELKDQLLRALAETENLRRRSERERADAVKYAAAPMLRDLLAVADNLSRAIESVPEDAGAGDQLVETLLAGVKLTERELSAVFERHHVVKLEPIGERLDPHRHEAMFEVPDESQPSGTIVQVVQPGYLLHDRLLRPARVGVSKGGPAKAPDGAQKVEAEGEQASEAAEPGRHIDTTI